MIPKWHSNAAPLSDALGRAFVLQAEVPCSTAPDGLAGESAYYDTEEEARAAFDGACGEKGIRRLRLEDWRHANLDRKARPTVLGKWHHPKLKGTSFA